jgi:hypothetical protein
MIYDLDDDTRAVIFALLRKECVSVEYFEDGKWKSGNIDPFYRVFNGNKLRLKPRTMNINGHDVPWPMTVAPAVGTRVYAASVLDSGKTSISYEWDGGDLDMQWLKTRILHLTEANARLHIKAILSFFEVQE